MITFRTAFHHFPEAQHSLFLSKPESNMNSVTEIPTESLEIVSDIQFLKKEINFLLKLLKNGYSHSIKSEKIKLLDGYWKGFEESIRNLESLMSKVSEEKLMRSVGYVGITTKAAENAAMTKEYTRINNVVKVIKEGFYEYMDGCCSCSFKN
ncbi:MAG TPA: hypothetical protein VF691_20705 [Cytophagaceae bacterium]|jgi:hypothetical protein